VASVEARSHNFSARLSKKTRAKQGSPADGPEPYTIYQFLLGMELAIYVGFSRLNHLRFVAQDPMRTGVTDPTCIAN
jgi:hypothetical protein